jgi:hypothetical protein
MSKKRYLQLLPILLSGICSAGVMGLLLKLNEERTQYFTGGILALFLFAPAISFLLALWWIFRPKLELEKYLLWLVSFTSLHIFTYLGTFYAIHAVSIQNENYAFIVGATTSGISAWIAGFILKRVAKIENNAQNLFLGGSAVWLLANTFQFFFTYLEKKQYWTTPHFGFYGFVSVYVFWQMIVAYNCLKMRDKSA